MGKEEKLSFFPKPSSSRPHPPKRPQGLSSFSAAVTDDADESMPQFHTVFDPSEASPLPGPARPVIPPIPNSDFRRGAGTKRMKNLLPPPSPSPSSSLPPPPPETKFILETNPTQDPSSLSYGLTLRQSNQDHPDQEEGEPETEKDLTLRRFREDMKTLPDDRGMDEFLNVPIESFAAAVLAGYGWSEGKGIGRNAKSDAKPVQYDRRAGTEGLGYAPSCDNLAPLTKRMGEVGFTVKNSNANPLEKIPENMAVVDRKERREHNGYVSHRKSWRDGPVRWLRSNIRVRVVSKDLKRGKLYLKKGEVVDVVGPTTCDIAMDGSGDLVQDVDQDMLETVLPKLGGSVLVLYGVHKGVYGSLMERNAEEETGMVRDADNHTLINVRLEQIVEYVGDPCYLGY